VRLVLNILDFTLHLFCLPNELFIRVAVNKVIHCLFLVAVAILFIVCFNWQ